MNVVILTYMLKDSFHVGSYIKGQTLSGGGLKLSYFAFAENMIMVLLFCMYSFIAKHYELQASLELGLNVPKVGILRSV